MLSYVHCFTRGVQLSHLEFTFLKYSGRLFVKFYRQILPLYVLEMHWS